MWGLVFHLCWRQEADWPPTSPDEGDQLDGQPCPCRGCDRWQTHRTLLLPANHQSNVEATVGVQYQHSVSPHYEALLLISPLPEAQQKPIIRVPSVFLSTAPVTPHMHPGQSSAAFVHALTDRKRNNSTNRPILWITGEHKPQFWVLLPQISCVPSAKRSYRGTTGKSNLELLDHTGSIRGWRKICT